MFLSPAVRLVDGAVTFIDQTRLPQTEHHETTRDHRRIIRAIQALEIRGAPLIGIAGACAVALAAQEFASLPREDFDAAMRDACHAIATARPTAVNLAWAVDRMRRVLADAGQASAPAALAAAAEELHRDDAARCDAIGRHGAALLPPGAVVITHCNTGFLATGGQGTALGIIAEAHRQGRIKRVHAAETRPLLQGARLTMWELQRLGIPCTLMSDSMAAMLMRAQHIDAVITGADRIAANGDAANKIGTYSLAVAAHHHGIPFLVAAPESTVDPSMPDGDAIPIEHRPADELTSIAGHPIAPPGSDTFTPAFDVTPATLITAIITERGVFRIGPGEKWKAER